MNIDEIAKDIPFTITNALAAEGDDAFDLDKFLNQRGFKRHKRKKKKMDNKKYDLTSFGRAKVRFYP